MIRRTIGFGFAINEIITLEILMVNEIIIIIKITNFVIFTMMTRILKKVFLILIFHRLIDRLQLILMI